MVRKTWQFYCHRFQQVYPHSALKCTALSDGERQTDGQTDDIMMAIADHTGYTVRLAKCQ